MKLLILSFITALSIIGCSTTDNLDTQSAEKAFKDAKSYEDDERYEEALKRYDDIKNRFPYSQYSKESDLRIAEVYYKKEDYQAAASAYSNFKFLYPNHPQIPYVSFQLGMSYFQQLPSTIDRDLSKGAQAITEFDIVINKYGSSEYAVKAQEKKKATQDMLAEKETYIADFYFKREKYLSALHRYEGIMKMPAPVALSAKAYLRAAICAFETSEFSHGKDYLNELSQKYGSSDEAKQISSVEKKYGVH
jgi:outer membrane protein assembly factor BamD